jgi:hypothetical protein
MQGAASHSSVELMRRASPRPTFDQEGWKRTVSPPAWDRATTFFIRHYVCDMAPAEQGQSPRDSHEYLPGLVRDQQSAFGLLGTIVAAAGYAALSNAGNVPEWRMEAFRLHGSAIRQLRVALEDPSRSAADETLGAVLLMGTFEVGEREPRPRVLHWTDDSRPSFAQTPAR